MENNMNTCRNENSCYINCSCEAPKEPQEQEDSGCVLHAMREFRLAGYEPINECDGPNKWIQENVFELLRVFQKQGHSGSSAPYVANLFKKLALFETITPIQGVDEEWGEVFDEKNGTVQNNRENALFKDKNGAYYLDAIVWRDKENCDTFCGTVENISSRCFIRSFPFTPKTFYIDVYRESYDEKRHSNYHEDEKGIKTAYVIKDESQLNEVWEYYKKHEMENEE